MSKPERANASALRAAAIEIVDSLTDAGFRALFVGGCVRDELLNLPVKDIDIGTNATPDDIGRLFPEAFGVGKSFGVMIVRTGGFAFEIATFRRDGDYTDGRRPERVAFCDETEDARRRDITINALFYDPKTDTVLDYVGGQADLDARVIRAVGSPERRFSEDYLRMLRVVRFASRFDFSIEPPTLAAIRSLADKILLIAPERAGLELMLCLNIDQPKRAFERLDETGLLRPLLPEIADMKGVDQPPQFHHGLDVWEHTLKVLDELPDAMRTLGLPSPDPELALAAALHDVGKPKTFDDTGDRIRFSLHASVGESMADSICKRLRLSNRARDRIVSLVGNHMRFMDVGNMRGSTLRRFISMDGFVDHLALHRADCMASHRKMENYEFALNALTAFRSAPVETIRPLLMGADLLALGFEPGPVIGKILRTVNVWRDDGVLTTRDEAIERVKNTDWIHAPETDMSV